MNVELQVIVSALAGIAEEMGAVLVRSSYSSNIKERRDCSCALFDAAGRMVAQAEHIPVHLGAMRDSVLAVIEREPGPRRRVHPQRPVLRQDAPPPTSRSSRRSTSRAKLRRLHRGAGRTTPTSAA